MATEECRSCHASIYWCEKFPVEIQTKGANKGRPKTMPVNADSIGDPKGNLEVWTEPIIPTSTGQPAYVMRFRYITQAAPHTLSRKRAISHYATCPDADKWRR